MSVSFENKETNRCSDFLQSAKSKSNGPCFESVKKTLNVPGFVKVIFHVNLQPTFW